MRSLYKDMLLRNISNYNMKKQGIIIALRSKDIEFKFLEEIYKDDEDVVATAIKNDPRALKYASKRLRCDKNIAILALSIDSRAIKYVDSSIKKDIDVVEAFNKSRKRELEEERKEREKVISDPKFAEMHKSVRAYLLYSNPEMLDNITHDDWNEMVKKIKNGEFKKLYKRR